VISLADTLSSPQPTLYSLQKLRFIALCLYSPTGFSVTQVNDNIVSLKDFTTSFAQFIVFWVITL